jgi:hypothetical protein
VWIIMAARNVAVPKPKAKPAADAVACRFGPAATRTWLTSTPAGGDATVADTLRIADDFDIYSFDKWLRISDLLAAAQAVGVFGVAGHTVAILHLAGEHGFVDRHRVTLTTPGYAVLCSDDLDTVELLTDHPSGVDAAIHLLAQATHVTETLLHQRARLARTDWPAPTANVDRTDPRMEPAQARRGRRQAFRPFAVDIQVTPPPVRVAANTATSTRRRR